MPGLSSHVTQAPWSSEQDPCEQCLVGSGGGQQVPWSWLTLSPPSGGKFAEKASQFDTIPLQRAGNKTEIAHSTLYLASPLSSYVTGTTLVVDGGSWLTSPNNFSALLGIASSPAKL